MRPGGVYHVISRFVAKQWFIASADERRMYLSVFGRAIAETDWRCFGYAVMSSHVHLALVAGTTRLATWMRPAHTLFAEWINARLERIGAVFVRGPNVLDLQPQGASRLLHYIHHNPVRAGVVARAADCDWTSQRAYLGLLPGPSWLDVQRGMELVGCADADAYAKWSETTTHVTRSDLDALRLHSRRGRGRPRGPAGAGGRKCETRLSRRRASS